MLNQFINAVAFPVIFANFKYPFPLERVSSFCYVANSDDITWIVLAYMFPKAKFYVFLKGDKKEFTRELDIKNVQTFSMEHISEFREEVDCFLLGIPYSSLNDKERRDILNFVKSKLKKGGCFYTEYDALPGSEAKYNFYTFLKKLCSENKLEDCIEPFINRPTQYLLKHQEFRRFLSEAFKSSEDKRKVIDEISKDYRAFFFFEVFETFSEIGLFYGGRANVELNDPEISLFPSHIPTVLKFSKDLRLRETAIDFILNINYRRDLFLKEPEENFEEAISYVCEHYFLIPRQNPQRLRRLISLPGGHRYPLSAEVYDYFFAQTENPRRLCEHPMFKGNEESIWKAFYKVVATGEFFLCAEEKLASLEEIRNEIREDFKLSPLNSFILEESVRELKDAFLVSEATKGPCIHLTPLEALLLWTAYKYGVEKAKERAIEVLKSCKEEKKVIFKGESKSVKEISMEDLKHVEDTLFKGRKAFNLQRLRIVEF